MQAYMREDHERDGSAPDNRMSNSGDFSSFFNQFSVKNPSTENSTHHDSNTSRRQLPLQSFQIISAANHHVDNFKTIRG